MVSKVDGSCYSSLPQSKEEASTRPSKAKRIWNIVYECVIKEFGSCLRHTWYRVVFWIRPHKNGLNPAAAPTVSKVGEIAKVVLLLHGAGAYPSSFIPMAKKLSQANIRNIYTVTLKQSEEDPVPVAPLAARVNEISQIYLRSGYGGVEFALVGHSLGALAGSKYIWREEPVPENGKITLMISLAGRLRHLPNKFDWFCEDVKPEIKATYQAFSADPGKVPLYSIWGDRDAIVPKQSAHIQGESSRECTVKGWGHGGIVFAPEAQDRVANWLEDWMG